jgi:hypothetical protein
MRVAPSVHGSMPTSKAKNILHVSRRLISISLDTHTVELFEGISPLISATSSGSGVRSVRSPSLRWSLQGSFGRGQGAMIGVAEREPTTISSNFLQSHHHILYLRSI